MTTIKNNNNDKYGRKKQLKPKQKRHAITENDNIEGCDNKKFKPTIRVISKESNAMINRKNANVHGQLYSPQLTKPTLMSSRHQRHQIGPEFFPTTRTKIAPPLTDISLNSTVQNNDITFGLSELNETSINTSAIPSAENHMIHEISFDQSININNTMNGNDRNIENNDFDNKNTSDGEPKKESIFNKIRGFFSKFISGIFSFFKSFLGFIISPFTKQQDTHESTPERSAQQDDLNINEEVNISENIQKQQHDDVTVSADAEQQQQSAATQENVSSATQDTSYISTSSPVILNSTITSHSFAEMLEVNDKSNDLSRQSNPYYSPF